MAAPPGPDGRIWALAIETRPQTQISIWDIGRTRCKWVDNVSGGDARCGHWAQGAIADFDMMAAVVMTWERSLELWDLRQLGRPVASTQKGIIGPPGAALRATPLGQEQPRALCGGKGGDILVFELSGEGGELHLLKTLSGHAELVKWAEVDWGEDVRLASLAIDGEVRIWEFHLDEYEDIELLPRKVHAPREKFRTMQDMHPKTLPAGGKFRTRAAVFERRPSDEHTCAVTGSHEGLLHFWRYNCNGTWVLPETDNSPLHGHTDEISAVCAEFKTGRYMSASLDRTLRIWETALDGSNVRCEAVLEGHASSVRVLLADFKADRALSAGEDETAHVWDIRRAKEHPEEADRGMGALPVPGVLREALVSFPSGHAAGVTREGALCVWDLQQMERIAQVSSHAGATFAVQIGGGGGGPGACTGGSGWAHSSW